MTFAIWHDKDACKDVTRAWTRDVRVNRVLSHALSPQRGQPSAAGQALPTPHAPPSDGSRLRAPDSLGHLHHRVAVGWPRVVPALRPFARSRLHGGAAAWRKAALPRRDDFLAAHRAEVIHGIAEQRVLVAVQVAISCPIERLLACAEAHGAPALHRPVHQAIDARGVAVRRLDDTP